MRASVASKYGVIMMFVMLLMASCATKYITVPEYHSRDSLRIVHTKDSVYRHDSVSTYMRGDTLRKDYYHYTYHETNNKDTVIVMSRDTVPKPYPVEKTVNRLNWWQKWLMWAGIVLLVVALTRLIIWIIKKINNVTERRCLIMQKLEGRCGGGGRKR